MNLCKTTQPQKRKNKEETQLPGRKCKGKRTTNDSPTTGAGASSTASRPPPKITMTSLSRQPFRLLIVTKGRPLRRHPMTRRISCLVLSFSLQRKIRINIPQALPPVSLSVCISECHCFHLCTYSLLLLWAILHRSFQSRWHCGISTCRFYARTYHHTRSSTIHS